MQARNVTTVLWTENYRDEFVEMKERYGKNLNGIMTDRPTELSEFCGDLESQYP